MTISTLPHHLASDARPPLLDHHKRLPTLPERLPLRPSLLPPAPMHTRYSKRAMSLATADSLYAPSPVAPTSFVRTQFFKTQMCQYFVEGRCPLPSSECSFAHDRHEIRVAPDLTKTRMCPEGLKCARRPPTDEEGHAQYCQFAHTVEELRATTLFFKTRMCRFWEKNGKCVLGEKCRFAHGSKDLKATTPTSRPDEDRSSTTDSLHTPTRAPVVAAAPAQAQNRRWSVCAVGGEQVRRLRSGSVVVPTSSSPSSLQHWLTQISPEVLKTRMPEFYED